jgi:glycosyltransferase involved in cell wall biosynthesis
MRNRQYVFPRYPYQIEQLEWPGNKEVVVVENDSTDRTRQLLNLWRETSSKVTVHILGESTGEKLYSSCVNLERFRILANAVNIGLDYIASHLTAEYIMFIESDIIWAPNLAIKLKSLVDRLDGLVAPMIWTERDRIFYDIWAFRYMLDGKEGHFSPHHENWFAKNWTEEYKPILSAGTCLMFKRNVLEAGARLTHEEAIVGLCRTAKSLADKQTYVAYKIHIYHPQ